MKDPSKRFWARVNRTDDCWLWTGWKDWGGYGILTVKDKNIKAHRFSWELFFGPIPLGLKVLHKCDVRLCVNPDHLFLGTNLDNSRDMVNKGRGRKSWYK